VLRRIREQVEGGRRLPPKYGALADYILYHPDEVAFLTAAELGRAAGVSEATVVRFATSLSYSGYPEFQRQFQRMLADELTTIRRLRDEQAHRPAEPEAPGAIIVEAERANLQRALGQVSAGDIQRVVRLLLAAPVIYVVGLRASACLAAYFSYQMGEIAGGVVPITRGGTDSLQLLEPAPDGVVVAFAFPRYPRETIEIVDAARELGLQVIGITDSFTSPLAERASTVLLAPISSPSFVDLYAAPMALAATLVLEASRADQERALSRLARFESFAQRARIFWRDGSSSATPGQELSDTKNSST
jgi:DNA-binding MurR/RpiR family transcriptional regulator